MTIEGDALVIRRLAQAPRAGCAEAAQKIAAAGDAGLVMAEFSNKADAEWSW